MCETKTRNIKSCNNNLKNKGRNTSKPRQANGYTASVGSEIYTTGTFEQFYKPQIKDSSSRNGFFTVCNRFTNMDMVRAFEGCHFKDDPHIKKLIKGLSCCSSMALVQCSDGEARLNKTSINCRKSICPICNRIKSAKYVSRFVSAYNSPLGKELFKNKYFSFITLTLKHNRTNVRTNVYLRELKTYLKQLQRSKLWKKHFPYSKGNPSSGWANCFETTISKNGFHIHVHILVCADKFKGMVKQVELDFREKWEKITGDSRGCRIDLIKLDNISKKVISKGETNCPFINTILEVFKYAVKVGNSKELKSNINDLAQFVIETKGQNMVVAGGFFRGLQLFGKKSIWDEDNEQDNKFDIDEDSDYYVGRTIDIKYSENTNRRSTKPLKGKCLDDVYIRGIVCDTPISVKAVINDDFEGIGYPRVFMNVSDCIDEFVVYFRLEIHEHDYNKLVDWIIDCRKRSFLARKGMDKVPEELTENMNQKQLGLFNGDNFDLSENSKLHLEFW